MTSPPAPSETSSKSLPQWLEPIALLAPAGIWLGLLLVIPTLLIFQLSLVPGIRPGQVVNPSGLENYLQIFQAIEIKPATATEPAVTSFVYLKVIWRSLSFAIGTTFMCLLLGFPVAYFIAITAPKNWRNLLLVGFVLPLWTSSLLRSYAWITILRPTGVLNSILTTIGLPALNLLNRPPAVYIGMTYSLLPYMVLILYASLEKLDRRLLEAAADLGATPIQAFWKVTVPQVLPGIAAGSLLVFITSIGDFVDPELLGGASSMTLARLIYNQFLGASQNWGFGSALSMIVVLAVSISIALLLKYGDRSSANL